MPPRRNKKSASAKTTAASSTAATASASASSSSSGHSDGAGPRVVATSQVSRFHTESIDTDPRDVLLDGVHLTVDRSDLLVDTRLVLRLGRHYALLGRNGTGKSTLMRAIATRTLVGFPTNLAVVMIDQHPDRAMVESDQTPLQYLLDADTHYATLCADVDALEAAVQDGTEAEVVRAIQMRRARKALTEAQRIADHRSGARGLAARNDLLAAEADVDALAQDVDEVAVDDMDAHRLLEELYEEINLYDEEERRQLADSVLRGLGFDDMRLAQRVADLSGGWQMRASLARSLFLPSDILICDEVSNNLDLPAIIWLQQYLQSLPQTVVLISHDRHLIESVAHELIVLRDKTLTYFDGTLSTYERVQRETQRSKLRQHGAIEKRRAQLQAQIQRNVAHARSTGSDKALLQAASRAKRIEKLGMEKTADGKRFKVSYRAGYHFDYRPPVVLDKPEPKVAFKVPVPAAHRAADSGRVLLRVDNLTFTYPGTTAPVLRDVTLALAPHDRVAVLGANGAGKSTLVKLLVGTLTASGIAREPGVRVGYVSQAHVAELLADPAVQAATPVRLLETWAREQGLPTANVDWHAQLGAFGIGHVGHVPAAHLSGGQLVKLALARAGLGGPQVYVLDEVTNHLDLASIEALARALRAFPGAVLAVSHDQWFVRRLVGEKDELADYGNEDASESDTDEDDEDSKKGTVYLVQDGQLVRRESVTDAVKVLSKAPKKKKKKVVEGAPAEPVAKEKVRFSKTKAKKY
ncbi:hypothetical protein AMAG_12341 [Allomyces macrogynus ATCC 38327]|uniref:ABC transporter domain-containing protein n=1 Tax=Allomyces macrogynus (strain ATCC 38327) TaxID=578462 RepID=A0A0L0SXZ9_ALLM3|nr:hypothetical protein AMAG_12341 [Allomyces macrogynus ATCC 38327]|eukprot:KNE67275.1 hypothetical protein AMAG_12341 [Allomyces macrogynus ATCC 38327]